MRICIDLDGVVAELRRPEQTYVDLLPVPGAVEAIRELRKRGHYVILFTARHMKTCHGNVGMVVAKQGKVTLDWLERHNIKVDEIQFGKPFADVYIDDCALRFESWATITDACLDSSPKASTLSSTASAVEGNGLVAVIPLAGRSSRFIGSRFIQPGQEPIKAFLDVCGKPMIWWALASLRNVRLARLVFVLLNDHDARFGLGHRLRAVVGDLVTAGFLRACPVELVAQATPLPGQLLSVLEARSLIEPGCGLLIGSADTWVDSDLAEDIDIMGPDCRGLLSVIPAEGENWSYVKLNPKGTVVQVAEKERISELGSTGLYCFADGAEFLLAAEEQVRRNQTIRGEHYVIPVYEDYLRRGISIRASHAHAMRDMGRPETLEAFLSEARTRVFNCSYEGMPGTRC